MADKSISLDESCSSGEELSIVKYSYGCKIYNPLDSDEYTILNPKISTIISSGRITMPNDVNDPDSAGIVTYGTEIELPAIIDKDDISVFIVPIEHTFKITNIESSFGSGVYIHNTGYMDSSQTYYKHNKATGEMTEWEAGDLTAGDSDEFDHIAGIFPVAFWDITEEETFSSVRLWAATCYLVYDSSEEEYIKVYSIGEDGVSTVDYLIAIKNYNY